MENTYLFYPARKVFKVLTGPDLAKQGLKTVFSDAEEMTLILRKQRMFFFKDFFEVKITSVKEEIASVEINHVYTKTPQAKLEKEIAQTLLKIF